MAKDIPSKKYKGVYYRELKSGDRSYFVILRIGGKQKRISIGKKSEGITEAFCYQQKVQIINSEKFGGEQAEILQRKQKSDPTFREMFDYFMKHGPLKESSKRVVQYLINQVPFAEAKRVTTDDVLQWQQQLKEKGLAPNSVDHKINGVSSVFKFNISVGKYRHENPCEKVPRSNVDDKRLRYLSRDEVAQLLDAVRDKPNLYLFVKLALCTGARLGTLLRIQKRHVKGEIIELYNVKKDRWYNGFLDEETQQLLKEREGYVFSWYGPDIQPTEQEYQWRMRRVFDELFNNNLTDRRDKVVIHTLRHTTASLLVQNGTPLQVVQKVLDHESIRSTERYAKLHQDNIKSELHRLWK